jgi:selenocysteine lyase/cysteine desulfurase
MSLANSTETIRSMFPILNSKIMLSSCSQSAMSTSVLKAFDDYQKSLLNDGMDWIQWMDVVESAKEKFAKLINCDSNEIAILGSVSDCISSVLHALPLKGKEVVTTELDFPCIGQAILAQQERQSFEVKFIPSMNNVVPLQFYEEYISENTYITCIPHVSYYNGFKQDLKSISDIAHEKGSLLFVDAYQSAGSIEIDVKRDGVDILVSGMQKYLFGIPGIAFMYIRKEIAENLQPSTVGWFSQKDPFLFEVDRLDFGLSTQRFNTGTPPVLNAYVANAALEQILNISVAKIEERLTELSNFTLAEAQKRNLTIYSPLDSKMKGPTTAIYCKNANLMESLLKQDGYILSARKDVIRLAPHIYNNEEDIVKALDAIEKYLPQCLA